jgi:very-short-patch-repair endonuclease
MQEEWLLACARRVRRHAVRRAAGIPTLTVLVGPSEVLEGVVRWLSRPAAVIAMQPGTGGAAALAEAYVCNLGAQLDLQSAALGVVADELCETAAEVQVRWRARSLGEQRTWLASLSQKPGRLASAAQWLALALPVDGAYDTPAADYPQRLRQLLVWLSESQVAVVSARAESARGLTALVRLTEIVPALQVFATADARALRQALDGLDTRTRAFVQAGTISLSMDTAVVANTVPAEAEYHPAAERRSTMELLRHDTRVALTLLAASASDAETAEVLLDKARSMAERLLYELLQAEPSTRDRFELNGQMAFRFGTRAAEVDLVSVAYKLAVEVDGYHHFLGEGPYRRDRRKDLLLQQHGFLVARFLATDVVDQGEQVLGVIKALVQERQGLVDSGEQR